MILYGKSVIKYLHHISARSLKSISSNKIILHSSNSYVDLFLVNKLITCGEPKISSFEMIDDSSLDVRRKFKLPSLD